MPTVNGKKFAYTAKGIKDAEKAKKAKKAKDSFSGSKTKTPVNKKSQAGDLGGERTTLRQAAQRNRAYKKAMSEYQGSRVGLTNVTYRDKKGKLKNSTMNTSQSASAKTPTSNYRFLKKKDAPTPKKAAPMPRGTGGGKTKPIPKGLAKPATRGAVRIPKGIVQKPARKGQQPARAKVTKPARKK